MPHYLYAPSNPSMPGLLKIGMTSRSVFERIAELNAATGVPEPFEIAFVIRVRDGLRGENLLHEALDKYRVHDRREFFRVSIAAAFHAVVQKLSAEISDTTIATSDDDFESDEESDSDDEGVSFGISEINSCEKQQVILDRIRRLSRTGARDEAKSILLGFLREIPRHQEARALLREEFGDSMSTEN